MNYNINMKILQSVRQRAFFYTEPFSRVFLSLNIILVRSHCENIASKIRLLTNACTVLSSNSSIHFRGSKLQELKNSKINTKKWYWIRLQKAGA